MNTAHSDPVLVSPLSGCRSVARWSARICSLVPILIGLIGTVCVLISGDYKDATAGEWLQMLLLGSVLLLAWRWEMIGGGLLFLLVSVNAYIDKMQHAPFTAFLGWMLAFLFLLAGSLKTAVSPLAKAKAIKAARILALLFALFAVASLGGCIAVGLRGFNG